MYSKYLLSVIKNSSSFCEYKYCQPLKQWSPCLPLLIINFEGSISCSLLSKINCYQCAWACVHTSRSPKMPYVLLTRCTYSQCRPRVHLKDIWTDRWHVWITVNKHGICFWESIHVWWKGSRRFQTPQWMWGYFCFTSRCSLILINLAVNFTGQWLQFGTLCSLLLLHQSPSSCFLPLISVFFPLWHSDNKTASTTTALGANNLHKCTQLSVNRTF